MVNLFLRWVLSRESARIEALLNTIVRWKLQLFKLRKVAIDGCSKSFIASIITLPHSIQAHTTKFVIYIRIRLFGRELQIIRELEYTQNRYIWLSNSRILIIRSQ